MRKHALSKIKGASLQHFFFIEDEEKEKGCFFTSSLSKLFLRQAFDEKKACKSRCPQVAAALPSLVACSLLLEE